VAAIEQVTGTRPAGYNNYWIRPGVNTLEILAELGFTYHIDDLSADEPFLQTISGQPFATVPYSVHLNDIASFDFPGFNPAAYQQQLTDEFDQLYAEGATRRRMMVIGLHERISGHASRVRVLDGILTRMRYHEDVWWARKDQIAQWTLDHPDTAALRDGTHGGAISRQDKERLFTAAVALLDPHARQPLNEINADLLLGTGEVTATGLRHRGGGAEAIWALSWPEQQAAGISPVVIRAYYGAAAHHPHLQAGTAGDWPLNVLDENQAAAELPTLRAIASADLHNLVFQRDYRIIPAIMDGWTP